MTTPSDDEQPMGWSADDDDYSHALTPPMPEWLEKKRDHQAGKLGLELDIEDTRFDFYQMGFGDCHALMAERKATPLEIAGIIESHSIRVTNFLKIINRTATTCGEEMEKIRQDQKDYAKQLLVMSEREVKLVEALKFYAQDRSGEGDDHPFDHEEGWISEMVKDLGNCAREAIDMNIHSKQE